MKDNLLYKRCSKLEKENQELKDTVQDKIECIIAYDEIIKHRDKEIKRLNNIINELEWKPIEQYEKPKYDWVLVKYYIEPSFECIPAVAEKRFDKWYNRNDEEIIGDVRYFIDMQQIDKLKEVRNNVKD